MLVKFGKIGEQLREYFIPDEENNLSYLLDMLNIEMDYDDVIHLSSEPGRDITADYVDDYNLEDDDTIVLESVSLTDQEEEIVEILDGVCINDMRSKEQRDLIKDLVKKVNDSVWDK